jgi:hypothetical protein
MAVPLAGAAPAGAARPKGDPTFSINWSVKASTHLKTLNETVRVPKGSFNGSVNLVTGKLTGQLHLPPASSNVKLAGVSLATATFKMVPTKAITGMVDLKTFHVSTKSVFNIEITSLEVGSIPVNLVGDHCATAAPVTLKLGGTASLTKPSTFSGHYAIPDFANCEALTAVINAVISGPGNSFTATFSPAK